MSQVRVSNWIAAAAISLLISACGGASLGDTGGTLGGTTGSTTGGSTTGGTTDPVPASITLLTSAPQLASDADAGGVTLTAVVKDASNNVLSGVAVQFTTPQSAEIVAANPATTDANGRVTATLTTGGDPTNRVITVTASTGTLNDSLTITVVGTTISISGPANTQINVPTEYSILLADAGGNGIAGRTVSVPAPAGATITSTSLTTDNAGLITVTLRATQASTTLTASALGITAVKDIVVSTDEFKFFTPAAVNCDPSDPAAVIKEVNIGTNSVITVRWLQGGAPVADGTLVNFAATRGALSSGTATTAAGNASVTINSPQAGFTSISASSDALTKPSADCALEFVATTPNSIDVQVSPSTISSGQTAEVAAVVRDANNNLVKNQTVEFSLSDPTSGGLSAATAVTNSQGLAKIIYSASTQSSGQNEISITGRVRSTALEDTALVTVGGRAVRIAIGTGSQIVSKDASTYQLPFTVIITDAAGNPAQDAQFRLSIRPLRFVKGDLTASTIFCNNEDVNNNGIKDGNEDADLDDILEPGNVASIPATVDIDPDDGSGVFNVTYPKDRGFFVEVMVTGVATVAGTEASETRTILLPVAEGDVDNLPTRSPYGVVLSCTNPG